MITSKLTRLVIFVLVICAPLSLVLVRDKDTQHQLEKVEKRKLFERPKVSWLGLGTFSNKFDQYFADNFGLRLQLVKLHGLVKYYLLNDIPRDNYLLGQQGWFYGRKLRQRLAGQKVNRNFDGVQDLLGVEPFSIEELQTWKNVLEQRYYYLKSKGVAYVFTVAPTKPLIYSEFLPAPLNTIQINSRAQQLIEYLKEESVVPVVDLVASLRKAKLKESEAELYLKTDVHWNVLGAFYAYQAIMQRVQQISPEKKFDILDRSDFTLTKQEDWYHLGFTRQLGFGIPDTLVSLTPNATEQRFSQLIRTIDQLPNPIPPTMLNEFPGLSVLQPRNGFVEIKKVYAHRTVTRRSIEGRIENQGRNYAYTAMQGQPELQGILLLTDSFLAKALVYFGVHAKETFRTRTEIDFNSTLFEIKKGPRPEIELVVQCVVGSYLHLGPPKNTGEVKNFVYGN